MSSIKNGLLAAALALVAGETSKNGLETADGIATDVGIANGLIALELKGWPALRSSIIKGLAAILFSFFELGVFFRLKIGFSS